jgi:hypothetical protein
MLQKQYTHAHYGAAVQQDTVSTAFAHVQCVLDTYGGGSYALNAYALTLRT